MTLQASGQITLADLNVEAGRPSTTNIDANWVKTNMKSNPTPWSINQMYGLTWYQRNVDGNCNVGVCSQWCNCSAANCANCDAKPWFQTNCNCACSYACNCNCSVCHCTTCDCSCFPAGTLVATTSGDVPIEDVKVGDEVLTRAGNAIVVHLWRVQLRVRKLWIVNGKLRITGDHLIAANTPSRWACIEPESFKRRYEFGIAPGLSEINQLEVGMLVSTKDGLVPVTSIEQVQGPEYTDKYQLYSLFVNRASEFYADGFVVDGMRDAEVGSPDDFTGNTNG